MTYDEAKEVLRELGANFTDKILEYSDDTRYIYWCHGRAV